MQKQKTLKSRLSMPEVLVAPGVYDALTALIAEQAGMEAVFLSGSSVSYSQIARADIGLITMNEIADVCARICDRVEIPVLVDVDSGFGNAAHAARTMRVMERAGAAAIQIEDQLPVKPSNNLKGRPLVTAQIMADKIKALVDARRNENTLISARSDSPASESLDQVIERILIYKEAGADLLFAEGLEHEDEVARVVQAVADTPVVYNLLRGNTELKSAEQLESLGVSVALFPGNAILSVGKVLQDTFSDLKENPTLPEEGFAISGADFNTMIGTSDILNKYKNFAG